MPRRERLSDSLCRSRPVSLSKGDSGTYMVSAGVAVLGVQRLVAGAAVRAALPHDVALAAQCRLALETTEVLHVPVAPLRLRTLVCQNNLGLRRHQEKRQRVSGALAGAKVK